MSIFCIVMSAWATRPLLAGSGSLIHSISALGTICHERPKRSSIQPQRLGLPPVSRMRCQRESTSSCDSHDTSSEMAGVNLKWGPPLRAMKLRPASSKGDGHDAALGGRGAFAPAGYLGHARARKQRGVELDRLLRIAIEP